MAVVANDALGLVETVEPVELPQAPTTARTARRGVNLSQRT
jgi:hypothetical protein